MVSLSAVFLRFAVVAISFVPSVACGHCGKRYLRVADRPLKCESFPVGLVRAAAMRGCAPLNQPVGTGQSRRGSAGSVRLLFGIRFSRLYPTSSRWIPCSPTRRRARNRELTHRQIVARWSKEGRITTEGAMVAARAPSQRAWPSACRGRIPRPAWNFAALLRDRLSHRIGASTPWGAGKCRVCATAGMCSVARPRRESPYPSVGPSGLWQDRITTLSMPPSAPPGSGRREHQDGAVGQEERPERVLHEAEAANMTPDECRLFSQVGAQVKR